MAFRTIAKVTVSASVRRPAFYLVVAVFAALIFLSHFFTLFTLGQPTSMVPEVGVSSILLCGVLVSIFLGAQSLTSEIESGTLPVLLTKPATRSRILLAKFAGVLLTAWGAQALLAVVFAITLAIDGKPFDMLLFQSLVLAFAAPALASASTLALATFLPFSPAVLASLCLFAFGSLSGYLLSIVTGFFDVLLSAVYAVLPDYNLLNLANRLSAARPLTAGAFAWSLAYAAAYTAAALAIASAIFSRREIK